MSAHKAERLMNLFILLLVSRHYVTKEQIRDTIEDYRLTTSDDAFEKKFERDKEDLRAIGVPIEMGSLDKYFDDELGYRIRRDTYELPAIEFTSEEVAMLGLAARVWEHAGLASSTADAVLKLATAGQGVDVDALGTVHLRLPAPDQAFDSILAATQSRTPVSFSYRSSGAPEASVRHLQPWGVVTSHGRWYVVGQDTDRGTARVFRLNRIEGAVATNGTPGSFAIPPDVNVRDLTRRLTPGKSAEVEVQVLARQGSAIGLRRWARLVEDSPRPGWDRLHLTARSEQEMVTTLLSYGAAIEVLAPVGVRDALIQRVSALAVSLGTAGTVRR